MYITYTLYVYPYLYAEAYLKGTPKLSVKYVYLKPLKCSYLLITLERFQFNMNKSNNQSYFHVTND